MCLTATMPNPLAQTAGRIVAHEAAQSATSAAVAAGAAVACERISRRLAPLIGDAGAHSLFARSLALTRADFPWLAAVTVTVPNASWSLLRTCIAQQPAETANEASVSLLATFLGLLEKFIGRGLTARLLRDAWPGVDLGRPSGETT